MPSILRSPSPPTGAGLCFLRVHIKGHVFELVNNPAFYWHLLTLTIVGTIGCPARDGECIFMAILSTTSIPIWAGIMGLIRMKMVRSQRRGRETFEFATKRLQVSRILGGSCIQTFAQLPQDPLLHVQSRPSCPESQVNGIGRKAR